MAFQSISMPVDKGLFLQANSFSNVPVGGLEEALNVIFQNTGLIQKRRGYSILNDSLTNPYSVFSYRDDLYLSANGSLSRVDKNSGSLSAISGSVGQRVLRVSTLNGNCYISSEGGVKKLETASDTSLLDAGVEPPLDLKLSLNSSTGGVVAPDSQVAYRVIQGRKDANQNLVLSAPSAAAFISNPLLKDLAASESTGTVTVTSPSHGLSTLDTVLVKNAEDASGNTVTNVDGERQVTVVDANTFEFDLSRTPSGTLATLDYGVYKNIVVEFTVTDQMSTEYFYQVYRSSQSAGENITPTEDLQLVFESNFNTTEISQGYVTLVDDVSDLLKGAYCYTNPNSGEGILNANNRPPQCEDIAAFKNHLFYANTLKRHEIAIDLVTVTTLAVNDTITIDGIVFTAKSTEDASNNEFLLDKSGTTAQNLDATARSLCRVINRSSTATVTAEYVSGYIDLPGKMLFKAKTFDNEFSVKANTTTAGSSFNPELPTDDSLLSEQEDTPNRIYISKFQEPEAVPNTSFIDVASKEESIQRLVALRDSLIVLTDKATYRINGNTRNDFTLFTMDTTVSCIAQNSVSLLGNRAYMLSNQGIVAVSDNNIKIISRPIEKAINSSLVRDGIENAVGWSQESDRNYHITMLNPDSRDTESKVTYVFNYLTQAWSEWDTIYADSEVTIGDVQYLLKDNGELRKERKDRKLTDFSEDDYTANVVSVASPTEFVINTVTSGYVPEAGHSVVYDDLIYRISSVVENETSGEYTVTLLDWNYDFEAGNTIAIHTPIRSEIQTAPMTMGQAGTSKFASNIEVAFRNGQISGLNFEFVTNNSGSVSSVPYVDTSTSGWGNFPWGVDGWGNEDSLNVPFNTQSSKIIKKYLPREVSRFTWLKSTIIHNQPCELFEIQSVSLDIRGVSSKNTRD